MNENISNVRIEVFERASWAWLLVIHGLTWVPASGSYFYHCLLYNSNQCFGGYENYAGGLFGLILVLFSVVTVTFVLLNLFFKGKAAKIVAIIFSALGLAINTLLTLGNMFLNLKYGYFENLVQTSFFNDWANRLGFMGIFLSAFVLGLALWKLSPALKRSATIIAVSSAALLLIGTYFMPYPGPLNLDNGFWTHHCLSGYVRLGFQLACQSFF